MLDDTPFQPMAADVETRVREAIEDIRNGRMIILTDDEDRENEGDLVLASEKVTPEAINFMARYARGLICLTLTEERADQLELAPMVPTNTSRYATAFTVSIEARSGVTTGISAADRARTVQVAIDPATRADDLARPGHIFPLRARDGGVLVRTGQTEGSVDLARLAGLYPSGVICEVMNDDGTMARLPDLLRFATEHRLHICTVADLIRYRLQHERLVHRVSEAPLPTRYGTAKAILFGSNVSPTRHLVVQVGEPRVDEPVAVRVHVASLLEDVFHGEKGENTIDVDAAVRTLWAQGGGILLYLYADGTHASPLDAYLSAYAHQAQHGGTVPQAFARFGIRRDPKDFGIGAQILTSLGLKQIRLLSNSPKGLRGLESYGLTVVDYLPVEP